MLSTTMTLEKKYENKKARDIKISLTFDGNRCNLISKFQASFKFTQRQGLHINFFDTFHMRVDNVVDFNDVDQYCRINK